MMVHDIRPEAVRPLVEFGAKPAGSAYEVGRHCRVVFSSLPGPREVQEVALGADGLLEGVHGGSVYVDLSSSSPDLIRHIEAEFRLRGARVMDAPLIVGKDGVANRSLEVLASGDFETFEEMKSILDVFSSTVVYTGPLGTGTVIKLAHNLVRRGIGLAIGEGIVLGAKAGVDPQLFWDCMCWGLRSPTPTVGKNFRRDRLQGKLRVAGQFRHRLVAKRCRPRNRARPPAQRAHAHSRVGGADHDPGDQSGMVRPKHRVPFSPPGGSRGHRGEEPPLETPV
jgi:3-hydroxyisobutyrate dehydrogenase-like beta-hydroxyacid dehydrogenase